MRQLRGGVDDEGASGECWADGTSVSFSMYRTRWHSQSLELQGQGGRGGGEKRRDIQPERKPEGGTRRRGCGWGG